MKARLFILLILIFILPLMCEAQSLRVSLEARAPMLRTTVNFHDDQWNTTQTAPRFEPGVIVTQRDTFTAKYSFTTGVAGEDTLTNPLLLVVGSTDFSLKQQAQGQTGGQAAQQNKSIVLSWKLPTTHRVECAFTSYPLRPFVVGSSTWFTVDATGENKEGKVVTDTETIQRFSWGVGASYAVPVTRYAIGNIKLAFGHNYRFVEASLVGLTWPGFTIEAGIWHQRARWIDPNFSITTTAPFIGVVVAF